MFGQVLASISCREGRELELLCMVALEGWRWEVEWLYRKRRGIAIVECDATLDCNRLGALYSASLT
jgi:hypothetical protein